MKELLVFLNRSEEEVVRPGHQDAIPLLRTLRQKPGELCIARFLQLAGHAIDHPPFAIEQTLRIAKVRECADLLRQV